MAEYAAAYTRMRALKSKLLSEEDFDRLLKTRELNEAVAFLGERTGIEIPGISSLTYIEHKLRESLLVNYIKIIKFLNGGPAEAVSCLISKFELINLKAILHSKLAATELPAEFIFHLGTYSVVKLEDLIRAREIEECFDILKGTIYNKPSALLSKSFKDGKPYLLDLVLDLDYYRRLHDSLSNLSYYDRQSAIVFIGIQIDVLNILRFLRLKFNYSFSPEEMFHYIFPYGLKFTEALFWEIAELEDPVSSFILEPYNKILRACQGDDIVSNAEILLNRYLFNFARGEIIRRSPFQLTPLLAFFTLKEFEIRDIISILNGKRLGLKEADIKKQLVTLLG